MNGDASSVSPKKGPFPKRREIMMRHELCGGCQFFAVTFQSSKFNVPKPLSTVLTFRGKERFRVHKMDFRLFHQLDWIANDVIDQRADIEIDVLVDFHAGSFFEHNSEIEIRGSSFKDVAEQ